MNEKLSYFLKNLNTIGLKPAKIEIASWRDWYLVSAYGAAKYAYISEGVGMGVSRDFDLAIMKAVVEYCERTVAKTTDDKIARLTSRSDGFAAYPVYHEVDDIGLSKEISRENSLLEATERYLWSHWWDDLNIKHELMDPGENAPDLVESMEMLKRDFELSDIFELVVKDSAEEFRLGILVAKNLNGGFISGGSCRRNKDSGSRHERAFGELLRHLIAAKNIKNSSLKKADLSFYQTRLMGFANGDFSQAVAMRIQNKGSGKVELPRLIVDQEVTHQFAHAMTLWRSLYEGQPVFMGGAVERFCI